MLETYIEGVRVFDRARPQDLAYQAGGFALTDQKRLPAPAALAKPRNSDGGPPKTPEAAPWPRKNHNGWLVFAGRLHTVAKGTIDDGVVLVEDGKIKYVGPRAGFNYEAGTPVLAAREVTPGLIDAHSVVGLSGFLNVPADQDHDELSDPNQADVRILDSFNPNEPLLQFVRENGVTVVNATPGRANVIAGQTGVFRTYGGSAEKMALRFPSGLLVNLGEVPKQSYPNKFPGTRMGTANLLRTAFTQAQVNARKRETAKEDDKKPPRNLKLEALESGARREGPRYLQRPSG